MAVYWGCDVGDVDDCRYQSTRTNIPVWTADDDCFCITKTHEKPAIHKNAVSQWNWKPMTDKMLEKQGWKVWKAEIKYLAPVGNQVCDVCGSDDVIDAPHMGKNCNRCHPL